jgi:hypothetical protein
MANYEGLGGNAKQKAGYINANKVTKAGKSAVLGKYSQVQKPTKDMPF